MDGCWTEPAGTLFQGVRNCIQSPFMPKSCASHPFLSCTATFCNPSSEFHFFYLHLQHSRCMYFCDTDLPGPVLVPWHLHWSAAAALAGLEDMTYQYGWSQISHFYSVLSFLLLWDVPKCISVRVKEQRGWGAAWEQTASSRAELQVSLQEDKCSAPGLQCVSSPESVGSPPLEGHHIKMRKDRQ